VAKTIEVLTAELNLNLIRYEKGFLRAQKLTNKHLNQMERRLDRSVEKMAKSGGRMAAGFNKAIATIGVGFAIRETVRLSDAWTEASNKIKAAEVSFGGSLGSVSDINKIANETRTALEPTVELYSRFARAGGLLGKSQQDVAKATEVANKAFKAGGAAVSEQRAAILQLSQGLQSGLLAGDELRSIRENAPLLAQAIADEMGVTIGQLKKLGSEGKITSDIVFNAIVNGAKKIEDQFNVTTPTISDSFTIMRNKAAEFISELNASSGAAENLSKFIVAVANNLDLLAHAAVIASIALGSRLAAKAMVSLMATLTTSSALLAATSGRISKVGAASILAARGIRKFNKAMLGVGGGFTLVLSGIAYALYNVVKANKQTAREQALLNKKVEDAEKVLKKYQPLLDETTSSLEKQTIKVDELAESYKTLEQRAKTAGAAQKEREILEISNASNDFLTKRISLEKELRGLRTNLASRERSQSNPELGIPYSNDKQVAAARKAVKDVEAEIALIDEKRDKLKQQAVATYNQSGISKQDAEATLEEGRLAQNRIKLEEDLMFARARGDKSKAQALDDELLKQKKIAEYRTVGAVDPVGKADAFISQLKQARKDGLKLDSEFGANLSIGMGAAEAAFESALSSAKDLRAEREKYAALSDRQLETELQAASIRGDGAEVERLGRILDVRERIADLVDIGVDPDTALNLAQEEQQLIDAAIAMRKKNDELEIELELQAHLANLRGDTQEAERLEREIQLLRTKTDLIRLGRSEADANTTAVSNFAEEDIAAARGRFREAFNDGLHLAAIEGDWTEVVESVFGVIADRVFENAANALADTVFDQLAKIAPDLLGSITDSTTLSSSISLAHSTGAGTMGTAITSSGTLAASSMGTAITAAGTAAASQIAGAMAAAGGNNVGGSIKKGIGSFLGSVLKAKFGGGRASGGSVKPGYFYEVNEQGREFIAPIGQELNVIPNKPAKAITGGARGAGSSQIIYAPVSNFYGHTEGDLKRNLDQRDQRIRQDVPNLVDGRLHERNKGLA